MATWEIKSHKVGSNQQELKVSLLVKDMQIATGTTALSWIEEFHKRLGEIKRTNIFSAEYAYKGTPRNESSLEVWKMKTNGDFNYKMFTVTLKSKEPYNPFNF